MGIRRSNGSRQGQSAPRPEAPARRRPSPFTAPHRGGSLVGREADLEALHALVTSNAPLVTLWGPAGMGKTRLACEYLHRHAPDGLFCDLSELDTAEAVLAALAEPEAAEQGQAVLRATLHGQQAPLLVLDNLEQVADAADAVTTLLGELPGATLIVTSRERLRLRVEHVHEVGPLGLPRGPDDTHAEAVRLLVARATDRPADELLAAHAADAVALVRRLEGVPLAIELAAARVELLGVHGLLQRMDQQLHLLASRDRDALGRQSTLRAALSWSWDLLDSTERSALCAVGLFRGPFSIDAAEAVVTESGSDDALATVQSLRDKSLLHVAGDGRMRLLESLRVFARERFSDLPEQLRARLTQRHADHYAQRARTVAQGQPLDDEVFGNLIAAAQGHAAAPGTRDAHATESVADILVLLSRTARTGGASAALMTLLDWTLQDTAALGAHREARLRSLYGSMLHVAGEAERALSQLSGADALVDEVEQPELAAEVVTELGVLHHGKRRLDQAADCYRRAMTLLGDRGPIAARARAMGNLGALHHDRRAFDVAHAHYLDALELLAHAPDARLEGTIRGNVGVLEQEQGNLDAARSHYLKAIELLQRGGERRVAAITVGNLGSLHHERGELPRARELYEAALPELQQVGDVRSQVLGRVRLGAVMAALGDPAGAKAQLDQAEQPVGLGFDRIDDALIHLAHAFVEGGQAIAAQAAGESEDAGELLARARARIELHRHPAGHAEPVEVSDDLRWLLRILIRFLTPHGLQLEETGNDSLVVAADGRFFCPPGGSWQDLRRYHVLRRMLNAFVERHALHPGQGLSLEGLQAAAWPSERIRPDALANRVYVAIAKLRKSGLKPHLMRDPSGYYLDPKLRVTRGEPIDYPS